MVPTKHKQEKRPSLSAWRPPYIYIRERDRTLAWQSFHFGIVIIFDNKVIKYDNYLAQFSLIFGGEA